ncbi:MAG TPA: DUF354 domain-containing protein [Candidatus Omnitrophota bacterium]|nr:DUF354 domain-containing protein [Candidatus Omnitrophota bacterium]HPN87760.1 DUF354 domain-containing protein [Candidatus Omnitrophota bacterium]
MNQKTKQVLFFFLNHPSDYHLFKNVINLFIQQGFFVKVGIVTKDVLEELVKEEKWDYVNLFPEGRRRKNWPIILNAIVNLFIAEIRFFQFIKKNNPFVLIGSEGTLAHIGFLLRIPSLLFNEDDTVMTPENYLFYPFATKVIIPSCVDKGKWLHKRISYNGYHELAYLHPRYFMPDENVVKAFHPSMEPYFILRLVALTASHDSGKKGITNQMAVDIIKRLERHGKVFISSERELPWDLQPYRLQIHPKDILHVLAFAQILIGDSLTMAEEAALLGTPSIRLDDFAGKSGYLNELEKIYDLTYGFKSDEIEGFFNKIDDVLSSPNSKSHWKNKVKILLVEKIDVVDFMFDLIKSYLPLKAE